MPQIQITCDTPDASIYYTIDGNDPSSSSNLYSNTFEINDPCTIKAIGIKEGYDNSNVSFLEIKKLPDVEITREGSSPTYINIINYNDYPDEAILYEASEWFPEGNPGKSFKEIKEAQGVHASSYQEGYAYWWWVTCTGYIDSETFS